MPTRPHLPLRAGCPDLRIRGVVFGARITGYYVDHDWAMFVGLGSKLIVALQTNASYIYPPIYIYRLRRR